MGRLRDTIVRWATPRTVVVEKAAYSWAEFERFFTTHQANDILSDYGNVGNPYTANATVYAAIRKKAQNIAAVEWETVDESGDPVVEPRTARLFANPYPNVSHQELFEQIVSNLENHGKAYIVYSEYMKGLPVSMWVANSAWMKTKTDARGVPIEYEYGTGEKRQRIPAEDVMFVHYWHPENPYDGLSPITAARLDVLQQFYANQYNANFFKKGGLIKGFFRNTAPRALSPEQEKELQRSIEQRGGGGNRNAHTIPVFTGVEYVPVGLNQKDMEWLNGQRYSMDQILMVLQTPKAILGVTDGFNYANMREIRKDFWHKSLFPIMGLIESAFESQFFERFGLPFKGAFNRSSIQELQEDLALQATTAKTFYDMGVPFQALNERLGLGFPDDMELEDKTPPQLMPFAQPGVEPDTKPAPDEEKPDAKAIAKEMRAQMHSEKMERRKAREAATPYDAELRRKEWYASEKRMKEREDVMVPKLRGYFADVHVMVKKYVRGDDTKAKAVGDAEWLKKFADYLNEIGIGPGLFKSVENEEVATFLAGAKRTYWGLGLRFDLPADKALAWVRSRGIKLEATGNDIRDAILNGLEEGMGSDDIAKHIEDVFENCSKARAKVIARTETTVAYNGGRVGGMQELGIKRKQWVNSQDATVRDSHQDGNIKELIVGIDEPFVLGSGARVMYPGDGPAAEACNCRCTVGSVIG